MDKQLYFSMRNYKGCQMAAISWQNTAALRTALSYEATESPRVEVCGRHESERITNATSASRPL